MLRLVQLIHASGERLAAVVEELQLCPLTNFRSIHELATAAIQQGRSIAEFVRGQPFGTFRVLFNAALFSR
jgi:hypothetical protein